MLHPRILSSQDATLLIVDIQESFRKVSSDVPALTRSVSVLIEASKILKLPVLLTEQYPQGLGKTLAEITACLGDHHYFQKTSFSCCQAEGFMPCLDKLGRKQVIVCGIEAHVCVNQTVHHLLHHGYVVHIVADAISSRYHQDKDIGIQKMISGGAVLSSVETALFEMLSESGTQSFKLIQRLIK